MFGALIIADENEQIKKLSSGLAEIGFACSIASNAEEALKKSSDRPLDLMVVAVDGVPLSSGIHNLVKEFKQKEYTPVVALLSKEALNNMDSNVSVDDFIVEPWNALEVAVRAKRVLWRKNHINNKELIACGDLMIDIAKCEVSLEGKLIALTFKEYELLRFLSSNVGRVFTRETLLNKVWGYDYYGGDRTVDVHIRRLRSKIEDPTHTFIETVRNIGYRFRNEV